MPAWFPTKRFNAILAPTQVTRAAIAPEAMLIDDVVEWTADQFFADRTVLVTGIAKESAAIVEDLLDAAEDRRPQRPRRRRRRM